MPAANWDIVIEENSQFDFYVKKFDSECNPTDVTGYGGKFQIREEKKASSTVLYSVTVGSGITIPTGTDGLFHIQLLIAQVNAPGKVWEKAYYDFVVWPVGGSITVGAKRLVEGRVKWEPAVTRP